MPRKYEHTLYRYYSISKFNVYRSRWYDYVSDRDSRSVDIIFLFFVKTVELLRKV